MRLRLLGTVDQAVAKITHDLPWTWGLACVFWGPILTANMMIVPIGPSTPHFRLNNNLIINLCKYIDICVLGNQAMVGGAAWAIWNCFLAFVANKALPSPDVSTDACAVPPPLEPQEQNSPGQASAPRL